MGRRAPDGTARADEVRVPLGQAEERRVLAEHVHVRPAARREALARDVEEAVGRGRLVLDERG